MRIVSYNIHGCVGTDGRRDAERVAAVLEALAPDVVALQEVDSRASRGGLDQAMIVARRLGMQLEEGPLLREHQRTLRQRGPEPLAAAPDGQRPVSRAGQPDAGLAGSRGRRAGTGCHWRIVTTHLDLRGRARSAQLRELAVRLAGLPAPLVLAGDLNEWRPWRRGIGGLADVVDLLPALASFPGRRPLLALDRLAVKGAFARAGPQVDASALARRASDHLPLWADVEIDVPAVSRAV